MNYDETITTLQFASRAIKIKVNVHVNEKIEMKRIKDKLQELGKIQKTETILQENKKLEKEANELKSNFNKFRTELKKTRGRDEGDSNYADNHFRSNSVNIVERGSFNNSNYNTLQNNNNNNQNNTNINTVNSSLELAEYSTIAKKFHFMILHLQSELAKATVTINGLQEENKSLKEKLAKFKI